MQDSAARGGLEGAAFFATPVGVMGRADEALPPARFKVTSNIDDPRYGALPVQNVIEVQTSPVPELGAVLYTFVTPRGRPMKSGSRSGSRSISRAILMRMLGRANQQADPSPIFRCAMGRPTPAGFLEPTDPPSCKPRSGCAISSLAQTMT